MSDSYFDSDTELYSGKRSSQYNEFVVNDIESLDLYQSIVSGYYIDEQKYVSNFFSVEAKLDSTVSSRSNSHPGLG